MSRWRRRQIKEERVREALQGMVKYGLVEVVTPSDDPLHTTYRFIDPEGVRRALHELHLQGVDFPPREPRSRP